MGVSQILVIVVALVALVLIVKLVKGMIKTILTIALVLLALVFFNVLKPDVLKQSVNWNQLSSITSSVSKVAKGSNTVKISTSPEFSVKVKVANDWINVNTIDFVKVGNKDSLELKLKNGKTISTSDSTVIKVLKTIFKK